MTDQDELEVARYTEEHPLTPRELYAIRLLAQLWVERDQLLATLTAAQELATRERDRRLEAEQDAAEARGALAEVLGAVDGCSP